MMKTVLLEPKEYLELSPTEDTQYVLIPDGVTNVDITMKKEGVSAEFLGIFSLKNKDEVELTTQSIHKVPNTSCMVNVKGALFDSAKSNYIGKIIIEKGAQQTASYLEDNVLILGDNVSNNAQPILEIEANDVKASHGATTGRIDKDQIYYLMSRGLSEKEAEETILEGFFEAVLSGIMDEEIRNECKKRLSNSK